MENYEKQLRKSKSLNAKLKVMYFFNEGVVGEWKENCDIISQMVDDGKCKSGAILAYGSFDDFNFQNLAKLALKKRVSHSDYQVAIDLLRWRVEQQIEFINKNK